ncbi:MAG: hypothetical protein ACOY0T_03570 [Myxococcota bacterium]
MTWLGVFSASRPRSGFGVLTLMGAVLGATLLASCGKDPDRANLVVSVSGAQPGVNCTTQGCPCSKNGATAACGETQSVSGDNVVCGVGTRTCVNGSWGSCAVEERFTKYVPQRGAGSHLLNLAAMAVSCGDVCDPACNVFMDTPSGLDPGRDLTVNGGTLTLPGREGGGSCNDVVVAPSSATITVTSLRPLVTQPASLQFSATCGAGGPPINPSWVLRASDADAGRIDTNGVVRVVAGIAKTLEVTGATAFGQGSATVDIVVKVDQVDAACGASADLFAAAASGVDPGRTLYPYSVAARPVVFPLGLTGPLVQWSTGGVDAACVKVTLDFPRGSANPRFHWSRVFATAALADPKIVDPGQPSAPIPDDAWGAFSQAAAGELADLVVQRHPTGAPSVLEPLPAIPVRFASDSLRATAFFTQYLRSFRDDANQSDVDICAGDENGNQPDIDINDMRYRTRVETGCVNGDCAANSAPACPVGNCTRPLTVRSQVATLQALDLANPSQGLSLPFGATAQSRCLSCHSISADGTTLVGSDYASAELSTIAKIATSNGRPVVEPITEAPTYTWTSAGGDPPEPEREQSKGLSYAALTPDGRFVLQGPNFWGNTEYDIALGSNNLQDAGYRAGGKRYFLLDVGHYRRSVGLATAGPLPPHTATADTLRGTAPGVLRVDGIEVWEGQEILVKDEPSAAENGLYIVEESSSTRGFRLVRRSDNGGPAPLAIGDKFLVEDGDENDGKYFHLAKTSASPIQLGTSELGFAMYSTVTAATSAPLPPHTTTFDSSGVQMLTGFGTFESEWVDGVPLDFYLSILVKDETGTNAPKNGIYSLEDPFQNPWRLVRRSEADHDFEVASGMRVRVNQGTQFGGQTFVLSTAGAIDLGTTALAFERDVQLDEGTKYDRGGVASTLPTMMFPTFAPDGSALVYVNGDSDTAGTAGVATGWRRGLSLLSFNAANTSLPFANKRRLVNTYSAGANGAVLKWPFFEPDSRGVVFVESSPDEFCPIEAYRGHCTGPDCTASTEGVAIDSDVERACFKWNDSYEYGHGNGAPIARGYWPGRLRSVSTESLQQSELRYLNDGLASQDALAFAADGGKAYQPNVLPFSAGGYRWVVFSSTRAYGNQLNAVGTHFTCSAPLLWIAALDDVPAGSGDRSYPAFLMPGQNLRSIWASNTSPPFGRHYANERGYVVPNACKTEHARCTLDSECCGGTGANPSMQCRLNTMTDPPSRSCELASSCRAAGDACSNDGQCCAGLCVNSVCSTAARFTAASFERVFPSNCPQNYKVRWGNFEWHADAPSTTYINFRVSVSDSATVFSGPSLLIGRADVNNSNPPPNPVQTVNVGSVLQQAEVASAPYLRVTMEFMPSADAATAPVLYDWNQRYDCLAAE